MFTLLIGKNNGLGIDNVRNPDNRLYFENFGEDCAYRYHLGAQYWVYIGIK